MSIPVSYDLDFSENQGIALRLESRTSDPSTAAAGRIWFRSDASYKVPAYWDGSEVAYMLARHLDASITGAYTFDRGASTPPFLCDATLPSVGSTATMVTNLNSNYLSGYAADSNASNSTIALRGAGGTLKASDPAASDDLVTLGYLGSYVEGIRDPKDACLVATTEALPAYTPAGNVLTADVNGSINSIYSGSGIDGITTLALNDRVLVKDETNDEYNGIYYVSQVGDVSNPWKLTRATDADTVAEVTNGLQVWVTDGTENNGSGWLMNADSPATLNTDPITFIQINGTAQITAGNGIVKSGNTIHFCQASAFTTGGLFYASGSSTVGHTGALSGILQGNGSSAPTGVSGTQYGLPYWATSTTIGTTAAGTSTQVLHGNAAGAPTWSSLSLTTDVTGTLPVANGGTGATTLDGVVIGNGTSAFTVATGTANTIVKWSGDGTTIANSTITDTGTLVTFSATTQFPSGVSINYGASGVNGSIVYSTDLTYFGPASGVLKFRPGNTSGIYVTNTSGVALWLFSGSTSTFTGNGASTITTSSSTLTVSAATAVNITPAAGSNLNITTSGTGDVAINTNQFYVDSSTGNVGIGTTGPGGTLSVVSSNATGTTTSSAINLTANSLTTGTGIYAASSSLTSGKLMNLVVTGTAAAASQTVLNITTSGATATSAITTYGAQIANTHTNATSGTNVALYLSASGATTANYGLLVASGNSGFGVESPTQKVDIRRSTSSGSDTAGTGDLGLGIDNTYWCFRNASTNLADLCIDRLYTGVWSEVLRIQRSTGNVGIGTASPNSALEISSASSNTAFRVTDTTNSVTSIVGAGDTQGVFGTFSNHPVGFVVNNSTKVTIDTSGFVGLNATDPGYRLEVRGTTGTGSASSGNLALSTAETTIVDGDYLGRILFYAPKEADGSDSILPGAAIWAEADATFDTTTNKTDIVFATATSETAAEGMRFTWEKYLGINCDPASRLEVRTDSLGTTQADTSGLLLSNSTAAAAGAQQISPATVWSGYGWKTDATAASQNVRFRAYVLPVQGAANPSGTWLLQSSINGGSYTTYMSLTSAGVLTIPGYPTSNGILRTDGSGVVSSSTDLPTGTTIGSAYVYRVGGTDVAVADGGTGLSSWTTNGVVFASASTTLGQVSVNSTATNKFLRQVSSGVPSFEEVDASDITGAGTLTVGTSLQFVVGNGIGKVFDSFTINTIQDITTTSSPTFGGLTINGAAVFNEAAGDFDFRVESQSLAYSIYVDAAKNALVFGSNTDVSSTDTPFLIDYAARTATAGTNFDRFKISNTNAVTIPTGTTALVTTAHFSEPNITATGTVTTAATVYISGAPTEGGTNYALLVDSGNTRLDGTLILSGSTTNAIWYADSNDVLTEVSVNSTATNKFLRQVSSGVPSYEQVALSDLSGAQDLSVGASLQITAGTGTGAVLQSVTVNTIQDIRTTASPTFGGLTINGATVLNEGAADADTRVESQSLAYAFYVDAAKNALLFGSNTDTSSTDTPFKIDFAARTATASTNFYRAMIGSTNAVTIPTGTTSLVATLVLAEPNITATGSVTSAATLYVAAAPTEGSSNYAIWVDSGNVRFDGSVIINGATTNAIWYANSSDVLTEVAVNSTATNKFLRQVSSGVPSYEQVTVSDIGSGAALTRVDDTNVTLTLGGSPTTALLAATSLTLGWTGTLSVARGGTGASSWTTNGILYASGTTTLANGSSLTWNGSTFAVAGNATILGSGSLTTPGASTLLQVQASTAAATDAYINLVSGNAGEAGIYFGDTDDADIASVWYDNAANILWLSAGAMSVAIDKDAEVMIIGGLSASSIVQTNASSHIITSNDLPSGTTIGGFASVRKFVDAARGNGETVPWTVNHGLGTEDITVSVWEDGGSRNWVLTKVTIVDSNNIQIHFITAPTAGVYYTVVVTG